MRMPLSLNDLRSHIFNAPTKWVRFLSLFFSQPKVSYFHMSKGINQNILGFQVSIHIAQRMNVINPKQDFNKADSGFIFFHVFDFFELIEKLAPRAVFHDENIKFFGLNKLIVFHNKRVIHLLAYSSFVNQQFGLALCFFFHELCGIKISIFLISHQEYLTKTSNSQAFAYLIFLQPLLLVFLLEHRQHHAFLHPSQP